MPDAVKSKKAKQKQNKAKRKQKHFECFALCH